MGKVKPEYLCLKCSYKFRAYKSDEEMAYPRRCPSCHATYTISTDEIAEIANETARLLESGVLGGRFPIIKALRATLGARGFKFKPRETLLVAERAAEMAAEMLERKGTRSRMKQAGAQHGGEKQ